MERQISSFILLLFVSTLSFAKQAPAPSPMGIIQVEEASVFVAPDFEAEIFATLPEKFELPMSRKVFEEAFHRVKLPDGRIGYINSAEITFKKAELSSVKLKSSEEKKELGKENSDSEAKKEKSSSATKNKPKKSDPVKKEKSSKPQASSKKISELRYFSAGINSIQYKENVLGSTQSGDIASIFLRLMGPDVLIEGLPTQLGLSLSNSPPKYYSETTGNQASGYFFLFDFGFIQPLISSSNVGVFINYGGFFKYSRFQTAINTATSVKELKIVSDSSLGVKIGPELMFKITDQWGASLGANYYIEKTQYLGLYATAQFQF